MLGLRVLSSVTLAKILIGIDNIMPAGAELLALRCAWIGAVLLLTSLTTGLSLRGMRAIQKNNHAIELSEAATRKLAEELLKIPDNDERARLVTGATLAQNQHALLLDEQSRLWASTIDDSLAKAADGKRPGVSFADTATNGQARPNQFPNLIKSCKTEPLAMDVISLNNQQYAATARMITGGMVILCATRI